ncbi:hypothetical protein G6F68_017297 [Rhizopus microsporus]|nr:hypothetical protein G6F68_017297 [Rhizopus microsporus]
MDESLRDENILALEKRVEKEKETNEEQENEGDDDSLVKLRITEYDSLQELMTDLSTRVEIKDASKNSWVHIGDDKCVLHVLSKGYLILERSHEAPYDPTTIRSPGRRNPCSGYLGTKEIF